MYIYIYIYIYLSLFNWFTYDTQNHQNISNLPPAIQTLKNTEAEDADEFQSWGNPSWCSFGGFLGSSVQFGCLIFV